MKKLIALTALAATVGLTACASDRHDKGGRDGDQRQGSGKKCTANTNKAATVCPTVSSA